ncbi:hypothetical protein R1flu_026899 [Riccia fluitans]|uniref:ATPase AAA-type core domain-containing protein n=1 Tax=Riccia fluitans TaxID=41844 RepID=A0ABD1XK46_9MARC
MFQVTRENAPSIIFNDEIDYLCDNREEGNENETSRQIKTELLVQMQGAENNDLKILILATTNTPYLLDRPGRKQAKDLRKNSGTKVEERKRCLHPSDLLLLLGNNLTVPPHCWWSRRLQLFLNLVRRRSFQNFVSSRSIAVEIPPVEATEGLSYVRGESGESLDWPKACQPFSYVQSIGGGAAF